MDDLQGGLKDSLPGNRLGEKIDRREFIRRLALVTGGVVVGTTLLGNFGCGPQTPSTTPSATPTLVPPSDTGVTVDPNDPRIEAGPVEFATAAATMFGYLSRPQPGRAGHSRKSGDAASLPRFDPPPGPGRVHRPER